MVRLAVMAFMAEALILGPVATASEWALWLQHRTNPAQVAVAPVGSLGDPWRLDSIWHGDRYGALKKACWLVRNGDITGRRYVSPQMQRGEMVCDLNCNCRS